MRDREIIFSVRALPHLIAQSLNRSISLLTLVLLLTSCTSLRSVIKIGLLAPFEGLHRRSGYAALTAMRQAIADYAPPGVAVMPLALDDGADPVQAERAVRKMVQDSAVRAFVGPYNPALVQSVAPVLASTGLPWLMPYAVDPTQGFVQPDRTENWITPLLHAAAAQTQTEGRQRLVVAGWLPSWSHPSEEEASAAFAVPLVVSDQAAVVQAKDAVLWLGSPEAGAVYLTVLRAQHPAVPFLLAPQADSPILSERDQIIGPVYLLFWRDDHYAQWRTQYGEASPTAYLTYRATQQAIAHSLGQAWPQSQSWRLQVVALPTNGVR